MVLYEIYVGTAKFASDPVASTAYSTESELSMVSLCQYRTVESLTSRLAMNYNKSCFKSDMLSIAIDQE